MHEVPFFKVRESSREDEVKGLQAGSLLGLETLEGVYPQSFTAGEMMKCSSVIAAVQLF